MRSGRGKCPQCKEIIVVDLDAPEIRCPLCNALLKKSQKTVEEVRAEEEARVAAALAREQALSEEAAAAETPVEETAPEEAPAEEVASVEEAVPAEETAEEVAEADIDIPEEASEEEAPVDEIGLTDEELAAMDDVPPTEEEQVDEIGLSDEELAAMDDGIPTEEETVEDDAAFADVDIPEDAEEGVEDADLDIPASVEVEEEPAAEEVSDEEAPAEDAEEELGGEVELSDEGEVADIPVEDALEEAPEGAVAEEEAIDEIPVEEAAEEPADEAEAVEEPAEEAVAEEETIEEAPAEEAVEEVAADDGAYVPTEEDMAFAASLSEGGKREPGKGFVAVVNTDGKPAKKEKEKKERKKDAPKGENKMSETAIYKKPVAVIMMILAVIGAAFTLLYTTNLALFGLISENVGLKVADIAVKIADVLPKSEMIIPLIFGGVLVLISILGLTGQRGKPGFLFALLASLVYLAVKLFGGADPIVKIDAVAKIIDKFGEYVPYAIYGLLLLAAVFFAVSISSGRDELEISGGTVVLPIVYMLVAVVGYVALVLLPKFISGFTVSDDIVKYVIFGIVGLSILMTLIGVHSATASRGANAWLLFAATMIVVLLYAGVTVINKVGADKGLDSLVKIFACVAPSIIFFPLIGYAVSDLRN